MKVLWVGSHIIVASETKLIEYWPGEGWTIAYRKHAGDVWSAPQEITQGTARCLMDEEAFKKAMELHATFAGRS